MSRRIVASRLRRWALSLGLIATALHAHVAQYELRNAVIASGGGVAAGGTYRFASTAGQSATSTLSGAGYALFGGYWNPVAAPSDRIFANGFEH